jgi:hypothetical protein
MHAKSAAHDQASTAKSVLAARIRRRRAAELLSCRSVSQMPFPAYDDVYFESTSPSMAVFPGHALVFSIASREP